MVLLDAVQTIAFQVATQMKDHFRMPRPDMMVGDLAPVIRTPAHSSFPSGHATEAFAAAAILGAFFPTNAPLLRQMATRIAVNRGFAGVHFPVDHHAGAMMGDLIANEVLRRLYGAAAVATVAPIAFEAINVPAAGRGASIEDYANNHSIGAANPSLPAPTVGPTPPGILPWLARKVWADVHGGATP